MRRIAGVTVALALTGLGALGGCRSPSRDEAPLRVAAEPIRPTRTPAGELARDFVQTRDQFVAAMDAKLVEFDAKLATLKGELAAGATATTQEATDAVAALEAQRAAARASLDEARTATAERWQQVKGRTDATLKAIDDTYDDVAAQLRR